VPIASGRAPSGVQVHLVELPVRLSVRRRWLALQPVTVELGPAVTLTVERASADPGASGGPYTRLAGAAGLVLAEHWRVAPAWALCLETGADLMLFGPRLLVDGGEVLAPRRVQLFGMLAVARSLSR